MSQAQAIAFTNARLVLADRVESGALLVRDGVIAGIGTIDLPAGVETVDCGGRLLAPGIVDFGVFAVDREACRRGGIVRVALMPDQRPVLDDPGVVQRAALVGRPDLWIHGDPHPMNLILDGGQLAGVVDWGDMTSGDPASDLATAWMMFDADARRVFVDRANLGGWYDDATWDRAKAWALWFALLLSQHCDDMPSLRAVGEHTLRELLDEPSPTAG